MKLSQPVPILRILDDANYGRWPYPVIPRGVADMPRAYLVHAQRQDLKGA